jgi:pimeloyl-ACP methyl ester carboxylesterase
VGTSRKVNPTFGTTAKRALRRHFVRVHGRGVHYLRAGAGPPVVLLHAAGMSSANSLLPLLQLLAADHTIFAFDLPGYGDSDPLPQRQVCITHAADAMRATLLALKLPRCPVYGTHTGGAVALELGRRHPERVSAVVVDGPTVFRPREARHFSGPKYLPPFEVKDDGSHLFATWVKARDQMIWFPWCKRRARNRRVMALMSPESLHTLLVERLRGGDGYRAVYRAAFRFDGRKSAAALKVPATFMAHDDDLIYGHLNRLPKLRPNQCVRRYHARDMDPVGYLEQVSRVLREYSVRAGAPPDIPLRPTPSAVNRRYVEVHSGQMLVRSAGESRAGRPLLLIHDCRASSRNFEPLMRVLAQRHAVFAPDLPGNGASDPLRACRPRVRDYGEAVARMVAALQLSAFDVYAVGAGAAVALDVLSRPAFVKARAVLEAPDFYASAFARWLAPLQAPPIAPQWDGAHLNFMWLMLRDEYAFWPWFDKSAAGAFPVDAPDNWCELHARAVDIARSLATYHLLTVAALRYNWQEVLERVDKRRITLAVAMNDPRRPHVVAAARRVRARVMESFPTAVSERAEKILQLFR